METITFVAHPHPKTDKTVWFGVCRTCGTMDPVDGTLLGAGDDSNNPLKNHWAETHICKKTPDYFALSEYGDINEYYGLDLESL